MVSTNQKPVPLSRPERFREALGLWAGGVVAPIFAAGSLLRQARVFHPRGLCFRAEVEPAAEVDPAFVELAEDLAQGEALVRLSGGLWAKEGDDLPDVLGFAIRFNAAAGADYGPREESQDLLLVSSQSLLTLPLALFETNQRNYLANIYYGIAKFELRDRPDMRLRVVPVSPPDIQGEDRDDRIREAVAEGGVVFRLETSSASDSTRWSALVEIRLQGELDLDERSVAFWPFRAGAGIRPQGFIQYLRPLPYLTSQWARRAAAG